MDQRSFTKEIRKYFETNENTIYQSLWDSEKAVLRTKTLKISVKKGLKSIAMLHSKQLEKEE